MPDDVTTINIVRSTIDFPTVHHQSGAGYYSFGLPTLNQTEYRDMNLTHDQTYYYTMFFADKGKTGQVNLV